MSGNVLRCPNCGKPVIVEAMCFDCAKAYEKGGKQGVIDAFNEILKQFEEAKYLENSPRDYKLRLKWFLEKRLKELEK
jgi:primosomal protein N'